MEENTKYFIGLDIGTNSCGYAVVDENYNIVKKKGKKFWGVRLYDQAETASKRRVFRTTRRQVQRKKLRKEWLRELFKEEIDKIDKNLFHRMKYSNLWFEDKPESYEFKKTKDSIFSATFFSPDYSDKDFYKEYPTIYHLRQELLSKPAKDVRFLYLALNNILDHRGNFLYDGDFNIDNAKDNFEIINNCINAFNELNEQKLSVISENDIGLIINEIRSKDKKEQKISLYNIFNALNLNQKALIDAIVTGIFKVDKICGITKEEIEDKNINKKVLEIDFKKIEEIEKNINDLIVLFPDYEKIVLSTKEVYELFTLKKILGNNSTICEAMVERYNNHKSQLGSINKTCNGLNFKGFVKTYYPEHYDEMFKYNGSDNYAKYVNYDKSTSKKKIVTESCSRDKFYSFVKKFISNEPVLQDELYLKKKEEILTLIENCDFLPKLRTSENSVFPNKLYYREAERILQINSGKFEFLTKKDENGMTIAEKILQIIEFKIPYFVGPLGNTGKNVWAKFNDENKSLKLYPWTLNKIIDFDGSEDRFIERMTNKCQYLIDKEVLPNDSIIYQKFKVLNELNNLKIDGVYISIELKKLIFDSLFKTQKKVSVRDVKNLLLSRGFIENDKVKITGIDNTFANNYSSFVELRKCFEENFIDINIEIFEKIIKYHTIISDKGRLEKRITNEFGEVFDDSQIKFLKGLNFSKWGNLSLDFLCKLSLIRKDNGVQTNIISELYGGENVNSENGKHNLNLMEILNSKNYAIEYNFKEFSIEEYLSNYINIINSNNKSENTKDIIDNYPYLSPAVKRGVFQSIKIVDEIISVMGGNPERIFVEVTRNDGNKGDLGRKQSRKNSILKYYDDVIKDANAELKERVKELKQSLSMRCDDELRENEKLFLYYLQLGKSMYEDKSIDIDNLEIFDVDHIMPRSMIKDDSIDNKVLVLKTTNINKSENYPLDSNIIMKMKHFWQALKQRNLISDKKFELLTRTKEVTQEELTNFIASQLVETNQSNKATIEILKNNFGLEVIYSKAQFVSEFRKIFHIAKSRVVNDYHHAKDAYLNVVVGNVMYHRFFFTRFKNSTSKENDYRYGINVKVPDTYEIFTHSVYSGTNRGESVWYPKLDIKKVKDICDRNDCLISRMSTFELNGEFYDQTIYKSKKNDSSSKSSISIKSSNSPLCDIAKYGGYTSFKGAYFMVIESDDKKGRKITIEAVPIYIYMYYKNDKDRDEKILKYVTESNNLKNTKIILPRLNFKSTLKIDGGEFWLNGRTGNNIIVANANQWHTTNEIIEYINLLEKYLSNQNKEKYKRDENEIIISSAKFDSDGIKILKEEISINREKNNELLQTLLIQLNKKLNSGFTENVYEYLILKKNDIETMKIDSQISLILGIVKYIATGKTVIDLSNVGSGKMVGNRVLNKNITSRKIQLINRSVTGIYEKTITLSRGIYEF